MALEHSEMAKLRQFLVRHFNISELKTLAFDLGTDHELFLHNTKLDFSLELIGYLERRNRLSCLVTEILRRRSDDNGFLTQLLAKLPPCSSLKKIQVIVNESSLLPDVSVFMNELAVQLNLAVEEIAIVGVASGSMCLLVSLPGEGTDIQVSYGIDIDDTRHLDILHLDILIDIFDSLDQTSQKAWRLIACNHPPIFLDNMLRPTVQWQEALEAVGEPQATHNVNLPSQLTPSELLFYKGLPQFIAILLQSSYSLRKAGKLPDAERCAQDAVKSGQRANIRADLAVALIYLADVYREMGKLESAMISYQRAYRIFQQQPSHYQRHNEAVSAYAVGLVHQLSDRKSDALEWYQTSGELFERVEKDWSLVNDRDQVKTCIRIRNWIKALMEYLVDVQVHTNAGYIWIPVIPLDTEKEQRPATSGSQIETFDGKLFRVRSLKVGQHPYLESDIVYYALNIPRKAVKSLDAATGDYALVEQQDIPEQEGHGVLKSDMGQDFGHFEFDNEGKVCFVRADDQVIIGEKDISKSARVGYITALLKPISASSDTFDPSSSGLLTHPLPREHDETEGGDMLGDTKGDQGQNGPTSSTKSSFPTQIRVFDPVWLFSDDLDRLQNLLQLSGEIKVSTEQALLENCAQALEKLPINQLHLSATEVEMSVTIRPRQVDVRWPHEWNPPDPKKDVVSRVQKFVTSRRHPLYFLARKGWQVGAMFIAFALLVPMTVSLLLSGRSGDILNVGGVLGILLGGILGALALVGMYVPSRSRLTLWKLTRKKFAQRVKRIAYYTASSGTILSLGILIGSRGQTGAVLLFIVLFASMVIWLFGFLMQNVEQ